MWSLSDESLLAGLASGDPEAATAFVRRFQGRVFGLALTMLGDPETARDVTQETFVRAWRYAAGYDPRRGEVAIWLLTIARNAAHNSRRLRRDEPLEPQQIVSMKRFGGDDPADRAAATQEREQLLEAIAVLPEQQRRALVLAAFGGRTAREISGIEGIPVGTAKTRIRSALLRLRSELEVGLER